MNPYIVLVGNVETGFRAVGPFPDSDEAYEWRAVKWDPNGEESAFVVPLLSAASQG